MAERTKEILTNEKTEEDTKESDPPPRLLTPLLQTMQEGVGNRGSSPPAPSSLAPRLRSLSGAGTLLPTPVVEVKVRILLQAIAGVVVVVSGRA